MGVESVVIGKEKVSLTHVNGEVLSYHKHSETHVSGGGGGPNNQYVSVRSTEVTQTEVFVKDESGREHSLVLRGEKGLVLREGQKVTLVSATVAGKDPVWACIYVHNTDREYFLQQRLHVYHNKAHWHWALLILMYFFFNLYLGAGWGWSIFWSILSTFFIVMMVTAKVLQPMAVKQLDKAIQAYFDAKGETILKYSGQTVSS